MKMIRAAGGVVYRNGKSGRREVLVVYRAERDDWTFPKGKANPDESDQLCACREVQEETGLRCVLRAELPTTAYFARSGRWKRVRYWVMRPLTGSIRPGSEVDEVRWVGLGAALRLLTYQRDRAVLLAFGRLGSTRGGSRRESSRAATPRLRRTVASGAR